MPEAQMQKTQMRRMQMPALLAYASYWGMGTPGVASTIGQSAPERHRLPGGPLFPAISFFLQGQRPRTRWLWLLPA